MKNLEKLTENELIKIMNDEYHSLNEAATDEYERRFTHEPIEESNLIMEDNHRAEVYALLSMSELSAEIFPEDAKEY